MKIYKATNCRHDFWPYFRDFNVMAKKHDLKHSKDQRVFNRIAPSFEAKVAQPKKVKHIEKWPRESVKMRAVNSKVVAQLEEKVNNLEYMVVLVYQILSGKELKVSMNQIKVPTHPREARKVEVEGESETESAGENIPPPLAFDPQSASTSGIVELVEEVSEDVSRLVRDHVRDLAVPEETTKIEIPAPTETPVTTEPGYVDTIRICEFRVHQLTIKKSCR